MGRRGNLAGTSLPPKPLHSLLAVLVVLSACMVDFDEFSFESPLTASSGSGAASGTGGSGGGLFGECTDPSTCPAPTTSCQTAACNAGLCGFSNAAQGEACTDGGGRVCDGFGTCVECVTNADCPGAQQCMNLMCVGGACADLVQNGTETDVDCGGSCPPCANGMGCNGAGDCTSGFCNQGTCNACTGDPDCGSTGYCNAGVCVAKKANGAACAGAGECTSGFCVDGACCDTACSGVCAGCLATLTGGTDGTCASIPLGQDPQTECMMGQVCQGNGTCGTCSVSVPPLGGMCPAVCDGGCANGVCTIACNVTQECRNTTITCPPGFACDVQCSGQQGCQNATIACPANHACSVDCSAQQGCRDATITCATGACDITCSSATQTCTGTNVVCGSNACSASCAVMGTQPTLTCGMACSCVPC